MSLGLFKNVISKMFTNHIYLVYKSKKGFGIKRFTMLNKTKKTYKQ